MSDSIIKKTMTRTEIINNVSLQTNVDKKIVKAVIEEYENILLVDLANSHETKLGLIGKIKISERQERVGINPQTGEKVIIPYKIVPKFSFSKGLKEFVANKISRSKESNEN